MSNQDMRELFGDGQGEYSIGDQVTFVEGGEELTGELIGITPPGETVRGRSHPTTYVVAVPGHGIPSLVYSGQIVAR